MKSVRLLGGATLRTGDEPLTGPPAQRHRVALLALVAASWPSAVTRDRAQALLWPEQDTVGARRLLNLAVHVLRRALGADVLRSVGDGLLFDPGAVSCDLHAFRAALADGRPDVAVRTWGGPFLAGFHLGDSAEFEDWAHEQRTRSTAEYSSALLECARRQAADGDAHGYVATSRRLAALDPFSADNALRLMRALESAGDRAGALRHYAEHEHRLRTELGVAPAAELSELAAGLRAAAGRAAQQTAADLSSGRRSPVVAIIVTAPSAGDGDIVADLHDRLASQLLRSRVVQVAAQPVHSLRFTSVLDSRRARADAVVEAVLAAVPGGLRLRIRLVDTATGHLLLVHEWQRRPDAMDELATLASAAIAGALTCRPEPLLSQDAAPDEAAALIARGHHFLGSRSVEALRKAVSSFERACQLAPMSATAWTGLAGVYAVAGFNHVVEPRESFVLARQAARRALSLNPAQAEAHAALGCIAKFLDWDWRTAERELRDAVHIDPGNPVAHQWFGNYLLMRAYWPEALAAKRRAASAAPASALVAANMGWTLHLQGEHERGIDHLDEAIHLDPHLTTAHGWRGNALVELGRYMEAADALRAASALSPASPAVTASLAHALARAGALTEAQALLGELIAERRVHYVPACAIARIQVAFGRHAEALRWLGIAARERSPSMSLLRVDPQFAPLRETPQFRRLLRRVGHV